MTKRAQIPFSAWLPAAMAAPTPVSALVHSSTLVTAGVYLLIRFFPLFSLTEIKNFLFIMGTLTIIISSLGALYEMDLKKIIALSTLRQLGLIMIALRINLYTLAFFHLLTHALFKASLFLCAGRVIHLFNGSQDIRNLSGVTSYMPLTMSCLYICSLSLGGFPFLSAFYSKDKIIEESLLIGHRSICIILLIVSIMLTLFYRFRLIYYISMERYDMRFEFLIDRKGIVGPIILLTVGGVIGGRSIRWLIFERFYDNLFEQFKVLILVLVGIGGIIGLSVKFNKNSFLRSFIRNIWFLPALRSKGIRAVGLIYGFLVRKS